MKEKDRTTSKTIEDYLSDDQKNALDIQAVRLIVSKENLHLVEQILHCKWNSIPLIPLSNSDRLKLDRIKRSIVNKRKKKKLVRRTLAIGSLVSAAVAACMIYLFMNMSQQIESPATSMVSTHAIEDQPVVSLQNQVYPSIVSTPNSTSINKSVFTTEPIFSQRIEEDSIPLPTTPQLSITPPKMTDINAISVPREMIASEGTIQKIVLSDGSQVNLYGGSTLTVLSDPDAPERRLSLKGKADFDVLHDKEKPFFVETQSLTVRVLGTTFGVSAAPAENIDRVKLKKGSVEVVVGEGLRYRLTEGQVLTYNRETFGLTIE